MSQDPSLPKFEIPLNDKGGTTSKNWYFFFQGLLNKLFSLTITDGTTTVGDVTEITVVGGTVTAGPTSGDATITVTGGGSSGIEFTDGVNTVLAATKLTVTGGTVGGTTPNATLAIAGGSGTVTSVALSDGSTTPIYTVTGSPVTTAGTLTETLKTQSANTLFAGPASGAAAQPGFRLLTFSDLPVLVPATIPDLQLWWTSSNILDSAGTPIFRFQEQTPWITGTCATSVTGGNSSSVVLDSTSLNGLPLAKWPAGTVAGSQILTSPLTLPSGATFFAVIKGSSAASAQAIFGGTTGALAFYLVGTAGTAKVSLVKSNTSIIGTGTNAWSVGTAFQCNATYVPSTGAFAFRQARASNGSGTGTTAAGGTLGSGSSVTEWIGADVNASTGLLNAASIGELLIYARVLTATEITNIENYLFAKWGV